MNIQNILYIFEWNAEKKFTFFEFIKKVSIGNINIDLLVNLNYLLKKLGIKEKL